MPKESEGEAAPVTNDHRPPLQNTSVRAKCKYDVVQSPTDMGLLRQMPMPILVGRISLFTNKTADNVNF